MKKIFFYSLSALIALLLMLFSVPSASAGSSIIYVRTDGDDHNCNGTENVAFSSSSQPNCAVKTIQKGVDIVASGGTVYVNDGTYSENIIIESKNVKLLSINGRSATTIEGVSGQGGLATILVDGNTSGVQIGDIGQGFTIIGIDNGNPGVENAALYFRRTHNGAVIKGNKIEAKGDHGLLSEHGATISNFIIDSNEFSGKTFEGDNPGGDGFSGQFTVPNVPRQLVVMGGGAGGTLTTNIQFTNNQVTGIAGGFNADGKEQGNTLVTIDGEGSLIQGNTFAGTTTRFATSLRVRRPNTTVENNIFRSSGLTPTTGHLFVQNNPINSTLISDNTFDKGVYVENVSGGVIGIGISPFVASPSLPSSSTVKVLPGNYLNEDVILSKPLTLHGIKVGEYRPVVKGRFSVSSNSVTIRGFKIEEGKASHGVDQTAIYIPGFSNIVIEDNHLVGTWGGDPNNFTGGRGVLTSGNVNNITIKNNLIERWVSGIYLNPTNGSIIVENNEIKNNWAGAGTDGQGNVLFKNNYFRDNIEGIGASSVGASFKVEENAFIGNTDAVKWYSGNSINASGNWWGSADKNVVGSSVSENVDYTPWLDEGTDTSLDPGFQGNFSTLWVVADSPQTGTEGRIQEAIDRASGSTVYVFPGNYIESATNRYVLGTNGPHQFGLFISSDKQGLNLIGVDQNGVPITDYEDVGAVITTTAKNTFGYSGIFVEGDHVTIQGFEIRDNVVNGAISNNKTIEVIGDNFTLRHCHVNVGSEEEDGGSIYIGDWRFDSNTNTSHIKTYTIENNWFDHGTSVDLANGAGYSGDVNGRNIRNNKFTNDGDEYWPFISFNGSGTGVPWFVYSVGGAVISGNDFKYDYNGDAYNGVGIAHIRARGTYDNSQFDWKGYWENNTFNKAVVFGPNPPTELGTYSYTSGSYTFNNVRRIGVEIATEVKQASNGHTVLAKKGTYTHSVNVNKSLIVKSEEGWEKTILLKSGFDINADNVTIDGFQILTGTVSVGVDLHGIYVAGGVNNIVLKNNVLIGSWTGGANNFVGGRGILTGYNVYTLTVENNLIEDWVSGLYLNPTNGSIIVQNNEIRNNWAGAGTDGQGNVLFKNNYFRDNIEGIGASSVGASFKVEENAFIGNTNAVKWYSGNPISAETNWWDGNKGPVVSSNPKGNGQPISSGIEYRPWLCDGTDTQPNVLGFQPAANAAKCTNLATKLVFTQYPASAFENIPFAQQPAVRAEDDEGNLAITFDNYIFIGIANNPVGGLLLPGPFYKKAVNGVATFSNLYINKAGQGYTLKAYGVSISEVILTEGEAFDVLKQQADLSVSIEDTPDPVNVDAELTYTVTVTNSGPHTAQGVSVSLQLPAEFVFQSAEGTGWSCSRIGSRVTCTRTSLGNGQAAQITVQGTAPTQAGSITATATVTLSEAMDDSNIANNQASATTTVVEIPPTGPSYFIYLPLVLNNSAP